MPKPISYASVHRPPMLVGALSCDRLFRCATAGQLRLPSLVIACIVKFEAEKPLRYASNSADNSSLGHHVATLASRGGLAGGIHEVISLGRTASAQFSKACSTFPVVRGERAPKRLQRNGEYLLRWPC